MSRSLHTDMSCKELVELVTEFLEGKMPQAERVLFEQHLLRCPPCVEYVKQLRDLSRAARSVKEEEIPEPTKEKLLEVFRGWKKS